MERLGVSVVAPNKGRVVETELGYMTTYRAMVPGSEVTFEMVPVPGGTATIGN